MTMLFDCEFADRLRDNTVIVNSPIGCVTTLFVIVNSPIGCVTTLFVTVNTPIGCLRDNAI